MHQSALACPGVRAQHASFIAKRLAIAFGALAMAPFFLAFRGAPTVAEAFVFAWCFTPLAAAMLVARSGRLVAGHGVAAFGLIGLGLTLWTALGAGAAAACLAVAQLEAALSGDRRLARWTALAIALSAGGFAAIAQHGTSPNPHTAALGLCAGLVVIYAMVVSLALPQGGRGKRPSEDATFWAASSEIIAEYVIGLDASGSVVRVPSKMLAGTPGADLVGRGLFELVHVADRPTFLKLVADAAHGDEPSPVRIKLRVAETEPTSRPVHLWFEVKARALTGTADVRDVGDPGLAVVASLRDVDSATRLDAEIAAAQSSVEEAIRSKDHFLANMSHELRTPLNAIIGFSEMLASHTMRPTEKEKQREYAHIIHQSGHHLLSVVNSILDMSKIRSGTFAIAPEAFDVVPLLDLSCDMVALKAEESGIALVRAYPARLEPLVGDKRACKQILINLLSNAVKFTPEGGRVTLTVRPDGNALLIAVSDTGIGIAASDLARLGDPFFQARSSLSRPFEGTGLGLSVVRGLVGLHGGTIELESELGRGTQVKVRLPLDCSAVGPTRKSATIETLARRQLREPVAYLDRRMKQIA